MRFVEFNGVDLRVARTMREPDRGIAKRRTQFDNTFRLRGAGNDAEQRTVEVGVAMAPVLADVRERCLAHIAERVRLRHLTFCHLLIS